jgi:transcriptional regulator with XRE-family HTH domain
MGNQENLLLQFGQRVRSLRMARQISQEELAALCNLDRTYISGIERGKRNVGLKNIAILAQTLEISLSTFFEGVDLE